MARGRGAKSISGGAEFLRRVEEMHRIVQRAGIGLRHDAPDRLALERLAAELQGAYCAIGCVEVVPWALDTTTRRHPRPWDAPEAG